MYGICHLVCPTESVSLLAPRKMYHALSCMGYVISFAPQGAYLCWPLVISIVICRTWEILLWIVPADIASRVLYPRRGHYIPLGRFCARGEIGTRAEWPRVQREPNRDTWLLCPKLKSSSPRREGRVLEANLSLETKQAYKHDMHLPLYPPSTDWDSPSCRPFSTSTTSQAAVVCVESQ